MIGEDASNGRPVRGRVEPGRPSRPRPKLEAFNAAGLDGLVLSLIANGHVPERVSLLGEVAGRVLA